jgi:hypothetical protein
MVRGGGADDYTKSCRTGEPIDGAAQIGPQGFDLQTIKISRQHEDMKRECKPPRHHLQQLQELRVGAIRRGTTAPINVTIPYMVPAVLAPRCAKGDSSRRV